MEVLRRLDSLSAGTTKNHRIPYFIRLLSYSNFQSYGWMWKGALDTRAIKIWADFLINKSRHWYICDVLWRHRVDSDWCCGDVWRLDGHSGARERAILFASQATSALCGGKGKFETSAVTKTHCWLQTNRSDNLDESACRAQVYVAIPFALAQLWPELQRTSKSISLSVQATKIHRVYIHVWVCLSNFTQFSRHWIMTEECIHQHHSFHGQTF